MAHLIKLEDYVSRYQFDIYRYPNQFTRLKKERWLSLKSEWEHDKEAQESVFITDLLEKEPSIHDELEEKSLFAKTVQWVKKLRPAKSEDFETENEEKPMEEERLIAKAKTLEQLKKLFIDEIYLSQLRWASSSLIEKSYLNPKYRYDERLKFFATQIPDNYLVMYKPIFYIKQARVDMGVLLISPTNVFCISLLEGTNKSIFQPLRERYWLEIVGKEERKVVSPVIELNRMASIVKEILQEKELAMPIKKIVLSPESYIDDFRMSGKIQLIDRRSFPEWKEKMRRNPSPIKKIQLEVAKVLLDHCLTTAFQRQEVLEGDHLEDDEVQL